MNRIKGSGTLLDRIIKRKADWMEHVKRGKRILTTVLEGEGENSGRGKEKKKKKERFKVNR